MRRVISQFLIGSPAIWATSFGRQARAALPLSCETFPPTAALTQLVTTLATTDIGRDSVPLAATEGDMVPAIVLFATDPARRIEIVWKDPGAPVAPCGPVGPVGPSDPSGPLQLEVRRREKRVNAERRAGIQRYSTVSTGGKSGFSDAICATKTLNARAAERQVGHDGGPLAPSAQCLVPSHHLEISKTR
jgi:hypothetical protein